MIELAVIFELAGVRFGIDILQIDQIMHLTEIIPLPESAQDVEGIVNLRGKITTVISLSRRLGLPESPKDNNTRIIVVEKSGKKIGFIVDRVIEVGTYSSNEMEAPKNIVTKTNYLKGIVKKEEDLWLVLNMEHVA